MSQEVPIDHKTFDWISARANCSPSQVFDKLRLQVDEDVAQRKGIMTENERSRYVFSVVAEGRRFTVAVEGDQIYKAVTFRMTPIGIDIHDEGAENPLHEGILTLSNDGECRLKVGNTEYNLWQFRKLALEDVLFTYVRKWRP